MSLSKRALLVPLIALLLAPASAPPLADEGMPHGDDFFEDCSLCHSDESWSPAEISEEFVHHDYAGFRLEGVHATVDCRSCHVSLVFAEADSACVSCHKDPHGGELGVDCSMCHTSQSFIDRGRFVRQHTETRFPLVGAHLAAECQSCHLPEPQGSLQWVGLPADCEACHLPDYQATGSPDHEVLGFPTDCRECHTPIAWEGAFFDHRSTSFPLTGSHRSVDCRACHVDGVYEGTPTDCYACHQDDYERADDPDHIAAAFPTDCTQCHNTREWDDAEFDHNATDFPLTGSHRGAECGACHANGVFSGTPTDCYACHQSDYESTDDPDHVEAGFPTDCTECHSTSTWSGAEFDHDPSFPIYSGTHRGRWNSCNECHVQAGNYSAFSCLECHPHSDRSGTDDDHDEVSGYDYDSQACYTCHPDGRE